ncbi:MAG: site-specific DNA-methyltransferase [Elusimicrobia bacterium]|nr:site-specific DNA-methyltransferase [Elusimicrobiota bacterium]
MPRRTRDAKKIPVETIRHKDKRTNIPTEELRGFVAEEEKKPKTVLYPRDPSLDPQLVWKGKDEQDQKDLAVPAVPIYIQEKIHPQVVIENVRAQAKKESGREQLPLFADFNGIKWEDLVDFYKHEQNWSNRMILGDSLMVMTSLAEKEGLKGKVQMIYMDPPYGIRFGSNWQVSTKKRDVKDRAEDATRQPEQVKAFRDTWELGIHSYLAYLRDRLIVARELLTESGNVFLQIGDENVHLVRNILDEVFGSQNCISQIAFTKTSGQTDSKIAGVADFILWYSKDADNCKVRRLKREQKAIRSENEIGVYVEKEDLTVVSLSRKHLGGLIPLPPGRIFRSADTTSATGSESSRWPYKFDGQVFKPSGSRGWSITQEGMKKVEQAGRLFTSGSLLRWKNYHDENSFTDFNNVWLDVSPSGFGEDRIYVVQTLEEIIKRCLLMTTDPGDLVFDPTCGSGTTATVAEQWGRRWITCDTSRVAIALARTRLMSSRFPYYLLSDTQEGATKEMELTGRAEAASGKFGGDIHKGFVYKRVPHVTLKSIANNPDIKEGMNRAEIDAAIARHAETETLYDQPYEDAKRVRVTGPFTVESLSPHRVLVPDTTPHPASGHPRKSGSAAPGAVTYANGLPSGEGKRSDGFVSMILENLKKAGVQNTIKKERLKFESLEPFAGLHIQAQGTYLEGDKEKRAAICIGPEHGTVGPDLVKEAAKEAVQGVGFDLLVVCGFAFDPHVSEEAKRYGKLTVLAARMNPDLAMGDELLKKTGSGNLFMVFGEPDVDIKKQKDGQLTVKLKGLDVYDPTTGEIRSHSTDDIACWFIDTDYNGESFFVRHAYFTGNDEPYEKLKKALRAEVDEAAWSALYKTESQPFDQPTKGKIAVKVINHYGDEVLKVFDLVKKN